jgi:p-aminobenzoyl-glutamate transporter AbgT
MAPTPREFDAYPPDRQKKKSVWASPMVRLIAVLLVLFFCSQVVLYRMAVRSVRGRNYDPHKMHDDLDMISDLFFRFRKAWSLLIF